MVYCNINKRFFRSGFQFRIAVYIQIVLIIIFCGIALHTKAQMCGNYCPFTVIQIFKCIHDRFGSFQLEKQLIWFRCAISGYFFPAFFAVLVGILPVIVHKLHILHADSTFISPKFVQLMSQKPLSEWIISVGRHEGFISSRQWIDTQNMLDDIAEKYNRPHRKTNALLAGLVYCPHCGKRLRVISESNRWTNGKPRFKYVCPSYRAGECTFRAVDGVLLDGFVVKQLSQLADEDSEYFEKLLNQKASDIFSSSQNEKELSDLRKKKAQLETAIANQVKNLREADDSLKRFIQEDVKALTDELSETETLLQKLEDSRQSQMYAIRDIEEIKERLLSFGKYAENAAPDVIVTLIQTFVERIYITDENDERHCHIFIKGCSKEDYDDFFRATGYIENTQETEAVTSVLPVCDSDECCKFNKCYR